MPANTSRSPSGASPLSIPRDPIPVGSAARLGSPSARLGLIIYSDFQCPYCKRFTLETLPKIRAEYVDTGLVAVFFKHLPLSMHEYAESAAEAAECARRQGRFWEMHDSIFGNQDDLDGSTVVTIATTLRLELADFRSCLDGQAVDVVQADAAEAGALGIKGTPAFLFGEVLSSGNVRVTQTLRGGSSIGGLSRTVECVSQEAR